MHQPPTRADIVAFRRRHGLSCRRLAAVLGRPASTVTGWLNGRRNPVAGPLASTLAARLAELDENPILIGPLHGKPGRPRTKPAKRPPRE